MQSNPISSNSKALFTNSKPTSNQINPSLSKIAVKSAPNQKMTSTSSAEQPKTAGPPEEEDTLSILCFAFDCEREAALLALKEAGGNLVEAKRRLFLVAVEKALKNKPTL